MTVEDAFLSRQRLLVIAPHADGECFGCAGAMARIKNLGGEVYVIVCSVGGLKHYDGKQAIVTSSRRIDELNAVMEFLQVDDWDVLYRDEQSRLRLDAMPRRNLSARFERESKLALDRLPRQKVPGAGNVRIADARSHTPLERAERRIHRTRTRSSDLRRGRRRLHGVPLRAIAKGHFRIFVRDICARHADVGSRSRTKILNAAS